MFSNVLFQTLFHSPYSMRIPRLWVTGIQKLAILCSSYPFST